MSDLEVEDDSAAELATLIVSALLHATVVPDVLQPHLRDPADKLASQPASQPATAAAASATSPSGSPAVRCRPSNDGHAPPRCVVTGTGVTPGGHTRGSLV